MARPRFHRHAVLTFDKVSYLCCMKRTTIIFILLGLLPFGLLRAAEMTWFDGRQPITYSVPKKVEPVVKVALEMWKGDM